MELPETEPRAEDADDVPPQNIGRFEVIRLLGSGGMGVVLEARDPDLDRRVAIKVMRPERWKHQDADARLGREAQAMAKLAHPNVIAVHEVGRVNDQTFIAMELVDGTTLRGWLAKQKRTWREIVAMFVAAGRGLAAAHASGMVHRDFKPDNVLVGADGRPRVSDFGLVFEGTAPGDVVLARGSTDTTIVGTATGTPAYMSTEQWTGQAVDARSDQFSFCVALWEALYGERPFAGAKATNAEIREKVQAGAINEPAATDVPRWIATALKRGLLPHPKDRWPDLESLLAALERGLVRRRWALVGATIGGAALATAGVLAFGPGRDGATCAVPQARIDSVWGDAQRGALAVHVLAIDPLRGAQRLTAATGAFDPFISTWSAQYTDACKATRTEGRQSEQLLDRRMECLDRALATVDATVRTLARTASPVELDKAIRAIEVLPDLGVCADTARLADRVAPPAEPAARKKYDDLERELTDLGVARSAGQLDKITEKATALVARARDLAHPELTSRALYELGAAQHTEGAFEASVATRRELIPIAAAAHDDLRVATTWIDVVQTMADALDKPQDAAPLLLSAEAAVARAGNPVALRYDLLESSAQIATGNKETDKGMQLLDEGRTLLEANGAKEPTSPLAGRLAAALLETGNVHVAARRWKEAVTAFEAAIAARTAQYGPDHPELLSPYVQLSGALMHLNEMARSIAAIKSAARIGELRMSPSPKLAQIISRVGSLLTYDAQAEEALPYFERGVAMARATMKEDDSRLIGMQTDYANALSGVGRFDEAIPNLDAAVAWWEKQNTPHVNWAITYEARGIVHARQDQWAEMIPWAQKSHDMFVKVIGSETPEAVHLKMLIARAHLKLKHYDETIALAKQGLAVKLSYEDSGEQVLMEILLGQALVESGKDKAGGLEHVRAGYAEMRKPDAGATPGTLKEVEDWIAKYSK